MKKAGELVLLSLEEERCWGELIAAFQDPRGVARKLERDFFTRACVPLNV